LCKTCSYLTGEAHVRVLIFIGFSQKRGNVHRVSAEFFPIPKDEQNIYRSLTPSRIVQKRFLILFCALSIFMLVAGCTAPAPSPANASQQNLSEQKNVTERSIEQTQKHTGHNPNSRGYRIKREKMIY
jgi:hypothetical protein